MSKFSKTKLAAALSASAIAVAAMSAFAQTSDGSLGADSTGTVDVSMDVNALVRITGLDTINLTDGDSNGVFDGSDTFCVGTNLSTLNYRVTLSMSTETDFILSGDSTDDASFTPTWNDGTTSSSSFVHGAELATDFNTISTDIDGTCDTPNTTLSLVTEDVTGFASTSFSETMTIFVNPQ